MKKALAILLCAAIAAAAGCGAQPEQTQAPSGVEAAGNAEAAETEAAETESEQQKYIDALPEADYGRYTFTMLNHEDATAWGNVSYYSEEQNGELLNDFVFQRNSLVSEKYNVNIDAVQSADPIGTIKKAVAAGDDTYAMVSEWIKSVLASAGKGYFYNLYSIPTINLENPWWDAECRDLLTISGRLFAAFSDMNVQPLDLLQGQVAVNNALASSLGFGVTTDKVFDGTWTFDAMLQMIQAAAADIDGSGTMDQNDQYGFIGGVGNINPMIVGAERKYIVTDNGQMKLNYGSESVIAAAGKMDPIINNKATSVYLNEQSWGNDVWKSGRALLIGVMVGTFYNDYRSLELDISLLPVPKYDEQQEKYHSMLSNCSMGVTVPASASDPERTGNIVEALNAYSYITINEVYYETTLQIKLARDDASQKILEIIVNSKTPDLAVFNENAWGNIITDFLNSFHKNGASQLASPAEKNAEKFQKIAEKIVGEYEALE